MATNILAPTEYTLSKNHRQALLASIPPKIEYPNGIVPFSALEQAIKQCPELENMAPILLKRYTLTLKNPIFFQSRTDMVLS